MSVTTGTGAKKTSGSDNWRTIIGAHNDTVDVYDKVKAAAAIFASAYDSTATYAAGDQCTHDGKWYVSNQAISTAEDWTAAHWTEITIASKLDTANVYNGLDKTASGFALDARQGKSLNEAIANVQDGLAIVANGNTHAAIGAGQFVYVKNHGTLADGLYTNTSGSTIAANATLSSSNLTADASGGLNSLNSKIGTLNAGNTRENPSNLLVASGTWTKLHEETLTVGGTYLIIRGADWGVNATGVRAIANSSTHSQRDAMINQPATNSFETIMQMISIESVAPNTTIYIYGYQNSGGSLNCYPYLRYIRLNGNY